MTRAQTDALHTYLLGTALCLLSGYGLHALVITGLTVTCVTGRAFLFRQRPRHARMILNARHTRLLGGVPTAAGLITVCSAALDAPVALGWLSMTAALLCVALPCTTPPKLTASWKRT